jgi:hypothetical protein
MLKRYLLAAVAIFAVWSVMDWIIHGKLLMGLYTDTAELWRPEGEMKMGLMSVVTLAVAAMFAGIYTVLVRPKTMRSGVLFGLLYGLGTGVSMGCGTFCYMPLPPTLALGWMLGTLAEALAAGVLVGWLIPEPTAAPVAATPTEG